ncbi:Spy/CpxP family protein refolding chaperone [Rhodoblastus sp.]|jgi:hypothetical protein|uniref:Spy/CpxP family protein refolding chaperone n=1 Tax=Rhodoblastus sp. TaxID=1962975 RepID=UPI0025D6E140|nr:Spy/CpxP family protein refolding chaperone [Rhodoblastus sp.]
MKTALKTLPLAFGLLAIAPLAWAQSPADHNAHHPAQSEAPAAAPAPTAGPPVQGGMGGAPMMKMMGGGKGMDMMLMMRMMMIMAGSGMDGMGMIDHVEGHIAFLRAELKITDAQSSAWSAFADAMRVHAQKLADMRGSMTGPGSAQQPPTAIDRIDQQERLLTARLDGLRTIKAAVVPLYAALSDKQKKIADELLGPHMGMGMMAMTGMSPGGMMGTGQMKTEPMPEMGK